MSEKEYWDARKVAVVGAGAVGSTFCYALAQRGLVDEIVLLDKNRELAEGQALDLAHGLPFFPNVKIYAGDTNDYANSQIIVITAGAAQSPGENRLNLLKRNAAIVEEIVADIVNQNPQAIIIMVSNPVDILTYVAVRKSGWLRGRIIGSGTVLDSARFRYLLSKNCNIDVHNIHAYILGEHGDSEFAAWSLTHVAGMPIDEYCPICMQCNDWHAKRSKIVEDVKNSAYHIIDYKGATFFAIGLALVRIVEAILRNQRSVLTVSTLMNGEYGIEDVCLSVPSIVSRRGVERIIEGHLLPEELLSLSKSASALKGAIAELYTKKEKNNNYQ